MTNIQLAYSILAITRLGILDHLMLMKGKISKSAPTKATAVKEHLLNMPGGRSLICKSISVMARVKNEQRKVFLENAGIWAGETSNI